MEETTLQLSLNSLIVDTVEPDYLAGLNAAQRQAVLQPRNRALQVLAGAGTGKTELISRRFVKLVGDMRADQIARPEERILVVTFTEDAAANMRERINRRLEEANEEPLGPRCWISTFHQFAGRVLRAHSLEAGLPPDFAILNPLKQQVLFSRVVQGLLAGDYRDLSDTLARYGLNTLPTDCLSPDALQAACGELLDEVVDLDRLRGLISRIKAAGVSPSEFHQEALNQIHGLTERLKTLPVPHNPDMDPVSNIQLKLDAWRSALKDWAHPDWNPVREAQDKHVEPKASDYKNVVKYLAGLYLAKRTFAPEVPDFEGLTACHALERNIVQIIAALYAVYQHALAQERACDFDDLINHSIGILANNPRLRAQYRAQFEHIIVDEFQDSNGSQLRLLQLLMREDAPNITVVGDTKQSIYGFRFAQPENMDLIFKASPVPPVTVPLQINYRSRPPILQAANVLTQSLTGDASQQLQPRPDWENSSTETDHPAVQWIQLGQENAETGKKEAIGPQKEREAHLIAVEIDRLVREGGYQFSDMAVLVKSHSKAERIQEALARFQIPAVRRKNLGFFQEPVIKDAMALLRLMHNLHDDASLVRILQSRLSQRQIYQLCQLKARLKNTLQSPSLFEALGRLGEPELTIELPPPVLAALSELAQTLLRIRKLQARPCSPVRLFRQLSEQVGIIHPRTRETQKIQQRLTLRMFEKLLHLFSQSSAVQPTLAEVLDILSRYEADPNLELPVSETQQGENAVQLMTIHGAKGLEFPVVFVAYTEMGDTRGSDDALLLYDPQFPGKAGFGLMLGKHQRNTTLKKDLYRHCWQKPRSRGEQQRLFYVALTRAQERLYVLRSNHSPEWTEASTYRQSAHLEVLDEQEHVEMLESRYWQVQPTERPDA